MRINANGRECMEFWARVEAEEHEREREIERQRELDRDGLDYINPDANCGANDPAESSELPDRFEVVALNSRGGIVLSFCEPTLDKSISLAGRILDKNVYTSTVEIVRTRGTMSSVVKVFAKERCGHA